MREFVKNIATQATGILLAALGAGLIAFLQSVASQTGACPTPSLDVTQTGMLGASLKVIHSAMVLKSGTLHT